VKRVVLVFVALIFVTLSLSSQEEVTPVSQYNTALESLKAKDYAKAYELFGNALEIADPAEDEQVITLARKNGSIAAYYYGGQLSKEEKLEDALAVHQKGIELNPDFYANYVGQGKVYNDMDMVKDAVLSFLKAGEIRTAAGEAEKADSYYRRAENIIAVAYSQEKIDETIEACQAHLEAMETPDAHYYLAKALLDKGSKEDAVTHAAKASELGGESEEGKYIFNEAEILESTGNKSTALELYGKVPQGKYYELAQYKIEHGL
jgi:tetratricopeptide (TPR) repeat protein